MKKVLNWLKSKYKKILKITGYTMLGLIFTSVIGCSLILSIQTLKDDGLPRIGKLIPMIITTDSMEPTINGGDLIFVKIASSDDVEVGDVISFWDPSNSNVIVTHTLKEVYYKNDDLLFKTKGDNNNDFDKTPVPAENLIGIYSFKIPYVGRIGMFLQSTLGLFTCLLIPLTIVLIIDYCRNRKREMLKDKEILLLKEELKKYQNKE